jgi:hypothetical protein
MRLLVRLFELRTEREKHHNELKFDFEGFTVTSLNVRDEVKARIKQLHFFVPRHLEKHNSIDIQYWNVSFLKISWSLIKIIYFNILLS